MVSGDGEVAQATLRGAGLPLVAMARREGYGGELIELGELRVEGRTPVRSGRRSGEGELGVSAKIERGDAPVFIERLRSEGKEGEREIRSDQIGAGEVKEGGGRKEREGVGGLERTVGPACQ